MASLTDREQQLIALGLQCYDAQPKIDYARLAELSGLKNASTASVMYGNAKRKLLGMTPSKNGEGADTPNGATTTPKKKATPRKRKPATPKGGAESPGENGDGDATESTPKKRARKTPAKKGAKSAAFAEEEKSDAEPAAEGLTIIKYEPTEAAEPQAPKIEETDGQEVKIEAQE
ncbi:hypothetical protein FQN54_005980 [Arachnomyces sp. PD_36]|nr:hypothetical protein FQN54_005980 [Arachnomyces sp. PD_36]